jgi:hypothetical protein
MKSFLIHTVAFSPVLELTTRFFCNRFNGLDGGRMSEARKKPLKRLLASAFLFYTGLKAAA